MVEATLFNMLCALVALVVLLLIIGVLRYDHY